jgi:hypothetical protein
MESPTENTENSPLAPASTWEAPEPDRPQHQYWIISTVLHKVAAPASSRQIITPGAHGALETRDAMMPSRVGIALDHPLTIQDLVNIAETIKGQSEQAGLHGVTVLIDNFIKFS